MKNILSIQSHVVYGYVGNSVAVFSMQRMGVNVWPLNTVQFSNHTQYGNWTGNVMSSGHFKKILQGILNIGCLNICDAVLSGYLGSVEQGKQILEIVRQVKLANPNALYFCDPVMGSKAKGCIVASGIEEFYCKFALPISDVIAPNLSELEVLTERNINSIEEAHVAALKLLTGITKIVLIKHLAHAGRQSDSFEMLLVTKENSWYISRPLLNFGERQPVGVGDLISALLLVNLLYEKDFKSMLEHVTAAVYEVILKTHEANEYELQLVASQNSIVYPKCQFIAERL